MIIWRWFLHDTGSQGNGYFKIWILEPQTATPCSPHSVLQNSPHLWQVPQRKALPFPLEASLEETSNTGYTMLPVLILARLWTRRDQGEGCSQVWGARADSNEQHTAKKSGSALILHAKSIRRWKRNVVHFCLGINGAGAIFCFGRECKGFVWSMQQSLIHPLFLP